MGAGAESTRSIGIGGTGADNIVLAVEDELLLEGFRADPRMVWMRSSMTSAVEEPPKLTSTVF